jgi:hypothetical protein
MYRARAVLTRSPSEKDWRAQIYKWSLQLEQHQREERIEAIMQSDDAKARLSITPAVSVSWR